ncbi:heavy metal-binding domain-containing protein [Bombilactobacillus bombi]|uniref:heavy metal-binding domain-containing protein n=1 Tax=Bombilactobacillus bombi TaxID=1303590 RepID=UPI0015E5A491|nr:heavy metal-binding domain-containing protein [Bombilactobacillus bombi]MBA1434399.1 heavy metal-binding domain-containing protein [Bombilactobacillus bombi]
MTNSEILVTTTEKIPGHNYEIIGEVFGLTTQSKNMFSDMGAGLKSIVGGEIKAYTKMSHEARDKAIERLREAAVEQNADAVVMMRFDSSSMSNDMQSVVAYGTAVRFID